MYPVKPVADNGTTTSINATVSSPAGNTAIPQGGGNIVLVSIGSTAGCYIRFGKYNDTVTAVNGFRLPPDFSGLFSLPSGTTHIYYLREGAADTTISLLFADGGI